MKKTLLTIIAVVMFGGIASSQISLGGRFYEGITWGGEVSLLYDLNQTNRIEADLGGNFGYMRKHVTSNYDYLLSYYVVTLTGSYQWQFNIIKGFGWFVGPAVQVGIGADDNDDVYGRVGLGAQGGVQYKFDFPLQVSLDVRPMLDMVHLNNPRSIFDLGVAAGVRYCF